MIRILAACALLSMTACGIDGDPVPPSEVEPRTTGVTLTGSVGVGISGTL